ncbi:MAG: DNA recombination protein RmuC, partial [Sphingomonadales bacterium]|nr:DNA recombination protein RmuC [Sphingomonadales bacterium]
CLLKLPNPPGPICVDSKFPLESYHHLVNAADDQALKMAMAEFRTAMKKHIKDISEKYIIPGETAESALMFLPSEAVYAELHARFPDIMEMSYTARVWIVSPTTLMATLNTVRAVLKDVRMREQAGVIQKQVKLMEKDVVRLDERATKLAKHLNLAERDVQDIQTSTGKVARHIEKIEAVQLEDQSDAADEIEKGLDQLPPQ